MKTVSGSLTCCGARDTARYAYSSATTAQTAPSSTSALRSSDFAAAGAPLPGAQSDAVQTGENRGHVMPPGITAQREVPGVPSQGVAQRPVACQQFDPLDQTVDITRRHEDRDCAVIACGPGRQPAGQHDGRAQHFPNLIQVGGHDTAAHGHVLEQLGGGPKEAAAVRVADMRGEQQI